MDLPVIFFGSLEKGTGGSNTLASSGLNLTLKRVFVIQFLLYYAYGKPSTFPCTSCRQASRIIVLIQAALRLFRFENPTVGDPSGLQDVCPFWGDGHSEQQIERFTCSFLFRNFIHRLQESVVAPIIS